MNHYEMIDNMLGVLEALKSGDKVEYRDWGGEWYDLPENLIPNFSKFVYRIKTEQRKYRVGLFKNSDYYTITMSSDDQAKLREEADESFVRWLTDWIEYKV